jgi:hypothetical protein
MEYLIGHATTSDESAPSAKGSPAINGYSPVSSQAGFVGSGEHGLGQAPSAFRYTELKTPSARQLKSKGFTDSLTTIDTTYTEQENSPISGFIHGTLGSREQFGTYSNDLSDRLGFLNLREFEATSPRPFPPLGLKSRREQPTDTPVHSQVVVHTYLNVPMTADY